MRSTVMRLFVRLINLPRYNKWPAKMLLILLTVLSSPTFGESRHCGNTGIWVEILGAGGGELNDNQRSPSFLIWRDNRAIALVDAGAGSSVAFDQSGAKFEDLEAILLTQNTAKQTSDLPAYLTFKDTGDRKTWLTILGPDGGGSFIPGTEDLLQRIAGPNGVYPSLSGLLSERKLNQFKVRAVSVPSLGNRIWAKFRRASFKLSAVAINHGEIPAIAWKVELAGQSIVFAGAFNNDKDVIRNFAKNADALIVEHSIPEVSRGRLRELYALPSELGKVASQADARMLILAGRTNRTRGRESLSRQAIEKSYDGPVLFGNDEECWGL